MFVTSKPTTQMCSLKTQEWRLACWHDFFSNRKCLNYRKQNGRQLALLFDVNRYNFVNMYHMYMYQYVSYMIAVLFNYQNRHFDVSSASQ